MRIPEIWRNNSQRLQFRGERCVCGEKTFSSRDCCPGCGEITFKPYIYKTVKDKEETSEDGLPSKKVVSHPLMHGSDGRIHSKCVPGKEKYLKHPVLVTNPDLHLESGNGKTKEQAEELIPATLPNLVVSGNGGNGKEIYVAKLMEELVEK